MAHDGRKWVWLRKSYDSGKDMLNLCRPMLGLYLAAWAGMQQRRKTDRIGTKTFCAKLQGDGCSNVFRIMRALERCAEPRYLLRWCKCSCGWLFRFLECETNPNNYGNYQTDQVGTWHKHIIPAKPGSVLPSKICCTCYRENRYYRMHNACCFLYKT